MAEEIKAFEDLLAGKIDKAEFDRRLNPVGAQEPVRGLPAPPQAAPREPNLDHQILELVQQEANAMRARDPSMTASAAQQKAFLEITPQQTARTVDREDIGIPEAIARAVSPRVGDKAQVAPLEFAKGVASTLNIPVPGMEPLGLRSARQFGSATGLLQPTRPSDADPVETPEQNMVRVLATMFSAFPQEAGLNIAEMLGAEGTAPETRGITQGVKPGIDLTGREFLLRSLQRVEQGRGYLDDFGDVAKARGIEEGSAQHRLAQAAGFAADVVIPWELPLKGVGVAAKAGSFAGDMRKLLTATTQKRVGPIGPNLPTNPDEVASFARLFLAGLREDPADISRITSAAFAKNVAQRGVNGVDDIPAAVRPFMADVAQKNNVDLQELITAAAKGDALVPASKAAVEAAPLGTTVLSTLGRALEKPGAKATLSDNLFSMLHFGQHAPVRPALTKVQTQLVDLFQEGVKQQARASIGDHRLVPLAGQTDYVTQLEKKRIDLAMRERLAGSGWNPKAVKDVDGQGLLQLNDRLVRALRHLDIKDRGVSHSMDNEVVERILGDNQAQLAGISANQRHVLRGSRQFSDAVLEGVFDVIKTRGPRQGIMENAFRKFIDIDSLRLPRATRAILERYSARLANNTADLADDIGKAVRDTRAAGKEVDTVEVLQSLVGPGWRPVSPEELQVVKTLKGLETNGQLQGDAIVQARDALLNFKPELTGRMGGLLSSNPAKVVDAIDLWRAGRVQNMRDVAGGFIEAMVAPALKRAREEAGIKGGRGSVGRVSPELKRNQLDIEMQINRIKKSLGQDLYEELVLGGNFEGPVLQQVSKIVKFPVSNPKQKTELMLRWLTGVRMQRLEEEALAGLAREGLAFRGQRMQRIAADVLAGRGGEGTRTEREAVWYALNRGGLIGTGSSSTLKRGGVVLDGVPGEIVLPTRLQGEITRARALGSVDPTQISESDNSAVRWFNWLIGINKEAVTHGLGLPNPKFFASQVLSHPFMLLQTLGPARTAQTALTVLKHPQMASSIMARMLKFEELERLGIRGASSIGLPEGETLAHRVFTTNDGRVYSASYLSKIAGEFGLNRTFSRMEGSRALLDDLVRENPGVFNNVIRKMQGWQGILREMSTATEMPFRIGVYLDGVKRGLPPQEAARVARESLYDYAKLTDAERKYARQVFMFYTFMRKNVDAFMKAGFNNPERVLAQLRFFRDQQHWWGIKERQAFQMGPNDIAKLVLGSQTGPFIRPDGTLDTQTAAMYSMTTPMPVPEALFMLYNIANLASAGGLASASKQAAAASGQPTAANKGVQESFQELARQSTPLPNLLTQFLTEKDPGGWSVSGYKANEIPGWMMTLPAIGGFMRYAFDPVPIPIKPGKKVPHDAGVGPEGLYYWAIDTEAPDAGRKMAMWRVLKQFLGRMMQTGRDFDRATQFLTSNPDAIAGQESSGINAIVPPELQDIVGLSSRPAPTAQEATRLTQEDRERTARRRASAIKRRL